MAVGGLLLHSLVDFNLQLPANALLFLLQAYIVTMPLLPSEAPRPGTRQRVREYRDATEANSGLDQAQGPASTAAQRHFS